MEYSEEKPSVKINSESKKTKKLKLKITPEGWTCLRCTFINLKNSFKCEICECVRQSSRRLSSVEPSEPRTPNRSSEILENQLQVRKSDEFCISHVLAVSLNKKERTIQRTKKKSMNKTSWTCPKCTFVNVDQSFRCEICSGVRRSSRRTISSDPSGLELSVISTNSSESKLSRSSDKIINKEENDDKANNNKSWKCSKCTFENFNKSFKCEICQGIRISSIRSSSIELDKSLGNADDVVIDKTLNKDVVPVKRKRRMLLNPDIHPTKSLFKPSATLSSTEDYSVRSNEIPKSFTVNEQSANVAKTNSSENERASTCKIRAESWNCLICTFLNSKCAFKCEMCGQCKGSKTRRNSWDNLSSRRSKNRTVGRKRTTI